MGLAGELSTIGLAEVLQNLAFNSLSGTLTVSQGKEKAHVAFREGRIVAAAVGGKIDYIDIARTSGVATEESLRQAATGKRRRTLKAFLAASGGFDEAGFDAAVRHYVESLLIPLFGWKNGAFEFEEGKIRERTFDKEQMGCGIDLDPQGLAMEAARRLDEWQTLSAHVPRMRDILVRTDGEFEPAGEAAETMLALIDGTRRTADVVAASPGTKHTVLGDIARLIEEGRVVVAEPADLKALAGRARVGGDFNLAARRLELALELDAGDIDARRELVKLHEKAERKTEAAHELMVLADLLAERGDMEGAREAQERASILAPGDLDVLERVFRFHEARGEKARALRAGQALAAALIAQEMHEDARPLYERLLEENPDSDPLREALAACLVQIGDTSRATQHLMMVAERAEESGDFAAARRAFRHVLTVDPECSEAKEHLERIDSGDALRARARRRLLKIAAAVVVVLAGAGWQGWREWRAQGALHAAATDVAVALAKDNGDRARVDAIDRYLAIARGHAFTRARGQARDTVAALVAREAKTIRDALALVPQATTTSDLAISLGRAEAHLKRLSGLDWPSGLDAIWKRERADLERALKRLK